MDNYVWFTDTYQNDLIHFCDVVHCIFNFFSTKRIYFEIIRTGCCVFILIAFPDVVFCASHFTLQANGSFVFFIKTEVLSFKHRSYQMVGLRMTSFVFCK